jgi:uncharacterized membrane protein YkvA (DUF1232 family)
MKIKKAGATLLIFVCVVYVLNPGAGVFELLPDNIPFLGNVDEALATYLIISCLTYLRAGKFLLPNKRG